MGHEHQRWDRDDYIQFNCKNFYGIQEVFDTARHGLAPGISDDEIWDFLCNDAKKARDFDAPSLDWIRGDGLPPGAELDGPDGFDYDSIMMYNSFDGNRNSDNTKETAVMVKVKKDSAGNKYVDDDDWDLPFPQTVSEKDAAFVRRFYPWGQPWVPPTPVQNPGQTPVVVKDPPHLHPRPPIIPPPLPPRPSPTSSKV